MKIAYSKICINPSFPIKQAGFIQQVNPIYNFHDDLHARILAFDDGEKLAFHVSRPVRWDSDHVLKLNDDLQEVANELVKCDGLKKSYIGLDYFDASINRVAALVIGARNMYKAILRALLTPWNLIKEAQDNHDHTRVLALQEMSACLPWSEIWEEFCRKTGIKDENSWFEDVLTYEKEVLMKRGN